MSARLIRAIPLLCATLLLAAGGAPFYWPLGLSLIGLSSVLLPWRFTLTTFGALLWMIAGATPPILWARFTTLDLGIALPATLFLLAIAAVRLFFENPLFGRNADRALVGFACIAEGIGLKSAAYPYVAVVLAVAVLVENAGGFPAVRSFARAPRAGASVLLLSVGIATFASVALPALDRATNRRFQSLFAGRMRRAGFSPHVRLDEGGFISSDEDIVLRLHGAETDYLRGAVFDSFDGSYWRESSRPRGAGQTISEPTGARTDVDAAEPSRWLFAPRGAQIVGDTPWETDALGVIRPSERRGTTHWAFATASSEGTDAPAPDDLALPAWLAPKLEPLAREWTEGIQDDRGRAEALVNHLTHDFVYTLDRPATPKGQWELLDFLFVHRQGHCEFFASAFVALARTLGIPARLVAGFRVVEHNGFGGYAVVRAKHAHAWAEAYVPKPGGRAGFEVFDATPKGVPTLGETRTRTAAAFFDYLRTSAGAFFEAAVASPERSIPALAAIIAVALVVRTVRNRRRQKANGIVDADVPPLAYVRFEALLAEQGFVRDGAETLEALAIRLELADREALARALRRYARARYGPGAATESELAAALDSGG